MGKHASKNKGYACTVQENNVQVKGELMEAKIKIPTEAKPHLMDYIASQLK